MDAAFTSFQLHGGGNHAVPVRCRRGERGRSRPEGDVREKTRLAGSDIVIFMGQCG